MADLEGGISHDVPSSEQSAERGNESFSPFVPSQSTSDAAGSTDHDGSTPEGDLATTDASHPTPLDHPPDAGTANAADVFPDSDDVNAASRENLSEDGRREIWFPPYATKLNAVLVYHVGILEARNLLHFHLPDLRRWSRGATDVDPIRVMVGGTGDSSMLLATLWQVRRLLHHRICEASDGPILEFVLNDILAEQIARCVVVLCCAVWEGPSVAFDVWARALVKTETIHALGRVLGRLIGAVRAFVDEKKKRKELVESEGEQQIEEDADHDFVFVIPDTKCQLTGYEDATWLQLLEQWEVWLDDIQTDRVFRQLLHVVWQQEARMRHPILGCRAISWNAWVAEEAERMKIAESGYPPDCPMDELAVNPTMCGVYPFDKKCDGCLFGEPELKKMLSSPSSTPGFRKIVRRYREERRRTKMSSSSEEEEEEEERKMWTRTNVGGRFIEPFGWCGSELIQDVQNMFDEWAKVAKTGHVKLWLSVGDLLEVLDSGRKKLDHRYDFIHTANIGEHVGMVNLLLVAGDALKRNRKSYLELQSLQSGDGTQGLATPENFIEHFFSMPVELFPSFFGLECCNPTDFCPELSSNCHDNRVYFTRVFSDLSILPPLTLDRREEGARRGVILPHLMILLRDIFLYGGTVGRTTYSDTAFLNASDSPHTFFRVLRNLADSKIGGMVLMEKDVEFVLDILLNPDEHSRELRLSCKQDFLRRDLATSLAHADFEIRAMIALYFPTLMSGRIPEEAELVMMQLEFSARPILAPLAKGSSQVLASLTSKVLRFALREQPPSRNSHVYDSCRGGILHDMWLPEGGFEVNASLPILKQDLERLVNPENGTVKGEMLLRNVRDGRLNDLDRSVTRVPLLVRPVVRSFVSCLDPLPIVELAPSPVVETQSEYVVCVSVGNRVQSHWTDSRDDRGGVVLLSRMKKNPNDSESHHAVPPFRCVNQSPHLQRSVRRQLVLVVFPKHLNGPAILQRRLQWVRDWRYLTLPKVPNQLKDFRTQVYDYLKFVCLTSQEREALSARGFSPPTSPEDLWPEALIRHCLRDVFAVAFETVRVPKTSGIVQRSTPFRNDLVFFASAQGSDASWCIVWVDEPRWEWRFKPWIRVHFTNQILTTAQFQLFSRWHQMTRDKPDPAFAFGGVTRIQQQAFIDWLNRIAGPCKLTKPMPQSLRSLFRTAYLCPILPKGPNLPDSSSSVRKLLFPIHDVPAARPSLHVSGFIVDSLRMSDQVYPVSIRAIVKKAIRENPSSCLRDASSHQLVAWVVQLSEGQQFRELFALHVVARHRRKGLGSFVVQDLLWKTAQQVHRPLWLEVRIPTDNKAAIGLFKKLDWRFCYGK